MSNSYQHEMPSARVNITLDVETGGSKSKKELPMKLLMLDDYSNGQAKGLIAERERMSINKHNFDQVLAALNPKVNLSIENRLHDTGEALHIPLEFKSLADFNPEQIVHQVPELRQLMAMRNLLKDLKSSVIDNQTFRKKLETVLKDSHGAAALKRELMEEAPMENPAQ